MNFQNLAVCVLSFLALAASIHEAKAEVRLHPIFTDNMVLQRDQPIPVWGTATPGEKVLVTLQTTRRDYSLKLDYAFAVGFDQASAVTDANGNWKTILKSQAHMPNFLHGTLKVGGADKTKPELIVKNIAIGDVYLCSGQSNMAWPVKESNNAPAEIAAANFPAIRLLTVPQNIADTPQKEFGGATNWQVCSPQSVPDFSAVAYFFGREIHQKTNVPIGLINAAWNGTVIEAWMSRSTLLPQNGGRELTLQNQPPFLGDPRDNPNQPSVLYNGMIAPLLPFPIRGAIWYQGESNADNPQQYQRLFPALIRDWRAQWNAKQDGSEFGFYFAQLANFGARSDQPVQSGWAELREAQRLALSTPRTGMATTIDIGEGNDIHPRNKQDVGKRLALVALAKEYGQKLEYSGPVFSKMEMIPNSNRVRISFTHAAGLTIKNAPPIVTATEENPYPNVPLDFWAYDSFKKLINAGILEGYSKETYAERAMNRYEFAVAIARLLDRVQPDPFDPTARLIKPIPPHPMSPVLPKITEPIKLELEVSNTVFALVKEFEPELREIGVPVSAIESRSLTEVTDGKLPVPSANLFQKRKQLDSFVKGFAIRGKNGNWFWAEAQFDGESIVLWSDEVLKPVAVRYAWANNPDVNLVNAAGLSAVPFRTDAP